MRKTSSKKWQLIFIDAAQQHNGGNNDPIKPNDMLVKYNCRHKAIGGLMKWVIRQLQALGNKPKNSIILSFIISHF